jgi:predicted amidohydrolase YtcJ
MRRRPVAGRPVIEVTMVRTVYVNADVWTMDPEVPHADSFSTEGGMVTEVPAGRRGSGAAVDLGGRAVVPGFTDSHVHFAGFSLSLDRVDVTGVRHLGRAIELIGKKVKVPGEWVRGRGFVLGGFEGMRFPASRDLDRAAPENPAAISSFDGHALWANTLAMKAAGITRATPDPAGGRMERDEDGEPTGIFLENAVRLVLDAVPKPGVEETERAMAKGQEAALSLGVTAVHSFEKADSLRALGRLSAGGRLVVRAAHYIDESETDAYSACGLEAGFGDRRLKVVGVKAYADGALNVQTAFMLEPYEGGGGRGILLMDSGQVAGLVEHAGAMRMPVAIHAIGDAAVREVASGISRARASGPFPHRIEHAQHVDPGDVALIASCGAAVSMQPVHLCFDLEPIDRYLGCRGVSAYAIRSLLDAGVTVAFGSDAPIAPMNPLFGIHAAVNRHDLEGRPDGGWHPEQAVTLREALACFTCMPARLTADLSWRGTLAPGKVADFAVLSEPLTGLPLAEIRKLRVERTHVDGNEVFSG